MGKITLGRAIADARERAGLTQKALAEKSGLSKRSIEQWEAGAREPTAVSLAKLGASLPITCDQLHAAALAADPPARTPQPRGRKPKPT